MIKKIPFVLCLALLISCSNVKMQKELDENGTLQAQFEIDKKTGLKNGTLERFYPDGSKSEKATYVEDKLHGNREVYHENGKLMASESYVEDVFDGPYKSYSESGELLSEGNYQNNAMEGTWTFYYPTGELKERVLFTHGDENGPFEEFHQNGKKKAVGSYKGGDYEHGDLSLYNTDGVLVKKMNCNMGRCETSWLNDEEGVSFEGVE